MSISKVLAFPRLQPSHPVVERTRRKRNRNPVSARVGIVENDEVFRAEVVRRLEALPSIETPVQTWGSAEAFQRDSRSDSLDLLFVDIMLGGITGIQLVKDLHSRQPELRIVMLTNLNSDEMIFEAIRYGTLGYILKSELGDLEDAIRIVLGGGALITPTIALRVFANFRKQPAAGPDLTDREKQVLELLVRGKTIRAVSEFLCLSPHTIHDHIKRIYRKLEVHNRAELSLRAQELSLL